MQSMWVWVSMLTITVASFLPFGPSFRYFPPSLISVPVLFLTLTMLAPHFLQACARTSTDSGMQNPCLLPILQAKAPLHFSVEASSKLCIHCVHFSTFPILLALHAYIFNSAVKVGIKQMWQIPTAEKLHWIENQPAMAFTWEFLQVTWRSTSSLPFLVHIAQLFLISTNHSYNFYL